jgi:hypothetical protein
MVHDARTTARNGFRLSGSPEGFVNGNTVSGSGQTFLSLCMANFAFPLVLDAGLEAIWCVRLSTTEILPINSISNVFTVGRQITRRSGT